MKHFIKFIALIMLLTVVAACGESNGKYSTITPKNGILSIPLSEVSDGSAHYYTVNSNGKEVKFFVLKSRDGVIRAAFDACDVCYPEKKGYRQEGEFMICNNCGQKFHSSRINVLKGGCNPSPLAREPKGDHLEISMNDVATGSRYF
ncbi:MAG: DUF2318 domain-containing protein [Denitrovibrio sp.]|nr:MAG: DUF2318 domain-containing protein [Denitrovibrio sp.]